MVRMFICVLQWIIKIPHCSRACLGSFCYSKESFRTPSLRFPHPFPMLLWRQTDLLMKTPLWILTRSKGDMIYRFFIRRVILSYWICELNRQVVSLYTHTLTNVLHTFCQVKSYIHFKGANVVLGFLLNVIISDLNGNLVLENSNSCLWLSSNLK